MLVKLALPIEAGLRSIVITEYRQSPFKYQGKCLQWLREAYADLDANDRTRVDTVLAGTGCEVLVA